MNVIFLGIDGVLTTARTSIAYNEACMRTLDPVAVRMIASICKQSNMNICISSSWRMDYPIRADFIMNLSYNGGGPLIPYILKGDDWKTPILGESSSLDQEVNDWLYSHPKTKARVVIDSKPMSENLVDFQVQTIAYEGYSFQNYLETIKIIEEKALLYGKVE